jgi:superoxide oxidase
MTSKSEHARYGALLVGLHWVMLLLIVGVYACIELRELYPRGSDPREALKTWHYMLGLVIFGLVWLRLLVRFLGQVPPILPKPPAWQLRIAQVTEAAMYLFMIAMPLLGWLILSAEGATVPFFGLEFPALIRENEALAEQLEEVHEAVGTAGYFLIGLHAAAALAHHYLLRDNALSRMLPAHRAR